MRFLILCLNLMLVCAVGSAQTSLIATLFHNGDVKFYYSGHALSEAYADAEEGDIITLSAGNFNAVDIAKNITIRGVGMGVDADGAYSLSPTVISGTCKINVPESADHSLTLEGLVFNSGVNLDAADNLLVSKCIFEATLFHNGSKVKNTRVVHSKISILSASKSSIQFINSYLSSAFPTSGSIGAVDMSFTATNCVVSGSFSSDIGGIFMTNCIIYNEGKKYSRVGSGSSAQNCVWVGRNDGSPFVDKITNKVFEGEGEVFKNGTFYVLSDELAAFKGNDGSQVGIYGGSLPFSPATSNPQITKFNVSPRTTSDGKLSVEIEVQTSDEL